MSCDVGVEGRLSDLPGQKREDQVTRVEHSRLQLANESGSPEAGKVPQGHREAVPALDELLQPGIGLNRSVEAPGQRSLAQEDRPEIVAEKNKSSDSQIGEERLQSLQVVPILAHRLCQRQPAAGETAGPTETKWLPPETAGCYTIRLDPQGLPGGVIMRKFIAAAAATLLTGGLFAQTVTRDYDHSVDFSGLKKFGWIQRDTLPNFSSRSQ